jgi:hypothetical protein
MNSNLVWVDPPSGWRYGFPKLYDREKYPNSIQWLLDNGYPQGMIDKFPDGLICGHSTPSDDEIAEYYKQVYYKY